MTTTLAFAHTFCPDFYTQLTARHSGFCNVVGCHFGTTFHARAEQDANCTVRIRLPGGERDRPSAGRLAARAAREGRVWSLRRGRLEHKSSSTNGHDVLLAVRRRRGCTSETRASRKRTVETRRSLLELVDGSTGAQRRSLCSLARDRRRPDALVLEPARRSRNGARHTSAIGAFTAASFVAPRFLPSNFVKALGRCRGSGGCDGHPPCRKSPRG